MIFEILFILLIPVLLLIIPIFRYYKYRSDIMQCYTYPMWIYVIGTIMVGLCIGLLYSFIRYYSSIIEQSIFKNYGVFSKIILVVIGEECAKFIGIRIFFSLRIMQSRLGRYPILRTVLFGLLMGFGFGLYENILYAFGDISLSALRSLLTIPLHMITTSIMSYYYIKSYYYDGLIARGLIFAIFLHYIFDGIINLYRLEHIDKSSAILCILGILIFAYFYQFHLIHRNIQKLNIEYHTHSDNETL